MDATEFHGKPYKADNLGYTVNIDKDLGCRLNSSNVNNRKILQNFLNKSQGSNLFVPANNKSMSYLLDKPLWVPGYTSFIGESKWKSVLKTIGTQLPAIILSPLNPKNLTTGQPVVLNSGHIIKIDSLLDGSVSNIWAWRSQKNSFLVSPHTSFQDGLQSSFETIKQFTIELILDIHEDTQNVAHICGMNDMNGRLSPYCLRIADGAIDFGLKTSDIKDRSVRLPGRYSVGMTRLAFQFDLERGTYLVIRDGKQISVTNSLGADFASGGLSFLNNIVAHFTVGIDSVTNALNENILDFTLCGLKLSNILRYIDSGNGNPAKRIDNKPVQDARLFENDPGTIGLMRNFEQPDEIITSRCLTCSPLNNYMLVMSPEHCIEWNEDIYVTIQNMTVGGGYLDPAGQVGVGSAILVSSNLHLRLIDSNFTGGGYAMASLYNKISYIVDVKGCKFTGKIPVKLCFGIYQFKDIHLDCRGEYGIVVANGSWAIFDSVLVEPNGPMNFTVDITGDENQLIKLHNFNVDAEGGPYPKGGFVRFKSGNIFRSFLDIEDIALGTIGPGAVFADLIQEEYGPAWKPKPAICTVKNIYLLDGNYSAIFRNDTRWTVDWVKPLSDLYDSNGPAPVLFAPGKGGQGPVYINGSKVAG
jgi:hypothetical protein